MLLRFLVKFLFLSMIIIGTVLFSAKWKLDKELDLLTASAKPVVEIEYESARINLSGQITIKAISLFFPLLNDRIEIGQLVYSHDNLYQMLFSEVDLENLPENIELELSRVLIPNNEQLFQSLFKSTRTSKDVLATAYCGNVQRLGSREMDAMGYSYFSFSTQLDYKIDKYSGNAIIKMLLDINDFKKINFQVNLGNFMAWNDSIQGRSIGEPNKETVMPNIELLDIHVEDQGYNKNKAEYCAIKQAVAVEEYYKNHSNRVAELFDKVNIKALPEFLSTYPVLIKPQSRLHLYMEPKATFEPRNLNFYNFEEIVDLTRLKIEVNEKLITKPLENWSYEQFLRIKKEKKNTIEDKTKARKFQLIRSYRPVSLSRANSFIDYRIILVLKDGTKKEGKLARVTKNNIFISIKIAGNSGYVTLPVEIEKISRFLVELEEKVEIK